MSANNVLTDLLTKTGRSVLVLDGGMGSLLDTHFHCDVTTALWSATINDTATLFTVTAAHTEWLNAGADIIITNTYQAPVNTPLFTNGLQAANTAVQQYTSAHPGTTPKLVSVSCGPYAALLADGSEYTGYKVTDTIRDEIYKYHDAKLRYLANTTDKYDMVSFETIPSYIEVEVVLQLIKQYTQIQFVLTVACKSETEMNDGTPVTQLLNTLTTHCSDNQLPNLIGIGFNCTPPQHIEHLISAACTTLQQHSTQLHIVVYPNAGMAWDAVTKTWSSTVDSNVEQWTEWVKAWKSAGASVIGGCCQTLQEHIKATADVASS